MHTLLSGSGYAISEASKVSGLSSLIGKQLVGLNVLPPFAIIVIICCLAATLTEFASNVATANILLPILAEMVSDYLFCYYQVKELYNILSTKWRVFVQQSKSRSRPISLHFKRFQFHFQDSQSILSNYSIWH